MTRSQPRAQGCLRRSIRGTRQCGSQSDQTDEADGDLNDVQPAAVVDTTAELLGRAKPRGTRTRTAAAPKARKTAVKKPAPARRGRAKKSDDA